MNAKVIILRGIKFGRLTTGVLTFGRVDRGHVDLSGVLTGYPWSARTLDHRLKSLASKSPVFSSVKIPGVKVPGSSQWVDSDPEKISFPGIKPNFLTGTRVLLLNIVFRKTTFKRVCSVPLLNIVFRKTIFKSGTRHFLGAKLTVQGADR